MNEDQRRLPPDEVSEPNEMRRRLLHPEFLRGRQTLAGDPYPPHQLASPLHMLARKVVDVRTFHGLSGEDAMTILAYHTMLHNERLYAQVMEHMLLVPRVPIMFGLDEFAPASVPTPKKD